MFDDSAYQIKRFAKILFIFSIVILIAGGLVAAIVIGKTIGGTKGFLIGAVIFLGIAGIGSFFSWIVSCLMYGFGDLIADMGGTRNCIEQNKEEIGKLRKAIDEGVRIKTAVK